jgi:hypothetical protein
MPELAPALAEFYYLKNFELVPATNLAQYADLLLEEEFQFITEFSQAPLISAALLLAQLKRENETAALDYTAPPVF